MVVTPTVPAETDAEWKMPGALMRLVADGLKERGFDVQLPQYEDERRFSVERWGGRCDLSVHDLGLVQWECTPWASKDPDPKLLADIAEFLLAGKITEVLARKSDDKLRGTSFMGTVGYELRARGFDVCLDVCEDNTLLEVWADILVKNPTARTDAIIRVSEDGAISWESDYPYEIAEITDSPTYFAVLENCRELADSIVTAIAHAVALSSGKAERGGDER
jgi:hypothetical protein